MRPSKLVTRIQQTLYLPRLAVQENYRGFLQSVHSSYTSPDADSSGGTTLLDSGNSAVVCKVQNVFISDQLEVVPLFLCSVVPYSTFYRLPIWILVVGIFRVLLVSYTASQLASQQIHSTVLLARWICNPIVAITVYIY